MLYGSPNKSSWDFPTAFSCWGLEEHAAIERVVASGQYTMGPEVAALETEFAAFHGRTHAIMVNSGSSANLIMLAVLRELEKIPPQGAWEPGNAFVPALAWATTYAPLVQHGLDLVLMDSDDSWNADAGNPILNPVHNVPRYDIPSLIVGCSILGNPARLDVLANWAKYWNCPFIEDNCESLGATIGGKLCGTFGLMSSFSLFHSHQISAIEGGVILTDDDDCARMCRMLRAHGWSRDIEQPASFEVEYDFRVMGYNVRPVEMHAAVARAQLKKLPQFIKARQENLKTFIRLTVGLPVRIPEQMQSENTQSPFGLHFEVSGWEARQRLVEALRAAKIDCRLPTGGSFRKHAYGVPWAAQTTPRADLIHERGLFLGNGPLDLTEQITRAVKIMKDVL